MFLMTLTTFILILMNPYLRAGRRDDAVVVLPRPTPCSRGGGPSLDTRSWMTLSLCLHITGRVRSTTFLRCLCGGMRASESTWARHSCGIVQEPGPLCAIVWRGPLKLSTPTPECGGDLCCPLIDKASKSLGLHLVTLILLHGTFKQWWQNTKHCWTASHE